MKLAPFLLAILALAILDSATSASYTGHHTYYNMILGDGTPMPVWDANLTTYLSTPLRFINGSIYDVEVLFPIYAQQRMTQQLIKTREALAVYMEGYEILQKVKYGNLNVLDRFFFTIPLLMTDPRRSKVKDMDKHQDDIVRELKTIKLELGSVRHSIRRMIALGPQYYKYEVRFVEYLLACYHNFLYLLEAISNGPVHPSYPKKRDLRAFFFTKMEVIHMAKDRVAYFRSLEANATSGAVTEELIPV